MLKKLSNFSQGKIYVIKSNKTDNIYIGSTTKTLNERLNSHKFNYKYYKAGLFGYTTSYKLLEFDDVYIELIENFPCNNKYELTQREGYHIRLNKNCVNKQIPSRTIKEYYQDNKDKYAERGRIYRELNKELIKQKRKIYIELNADKIRETKYKKHICECGKVYTYTHKKRHEKTIKHQKYLNNKLNISTNNIEVTCPDIQNQLQKDMEQGSTECVEVLKL